MNHKDLLEYIEDRERRGHTADVILALLKNSLKYGNKKWLKDVK